MAQGDLDFARDILQRGERAHYAVHFCHQAIEKLLKAIVQEKTENDALRTHNFKLLVEQGNLTIPPEMETLFVRLAPHYLASKYPEDIDEFYRTYTASYGMDLLTITEELFQWLELQLISHP
jgi:HEPN domain-containing protein